MRTWLRNHPSGSRRRWLAERLRWVADRIGPEDCFVQMTAFSVHLEVKRGWVLDRTAERGVRMWARQEDYDENAWG